MTLKDFFTKSESPKSVGESINMFLKLWGFSILIVMAIALLFNL